MIDGTQVSHEISSNARFAATHVVSPARNASPGVLLLLPHSALTRVAIERAAATTAALGGHLYILLTIPRAAPICHPALMLSEVCKLAARSLAGRPFDVELVRGNPIELALAAARARPFALVVVDSTFDPKIACKLAEHFNRPVLVARDARPSGEVIAASDMSHTGYPVLTFARKFARPLDRPLTFFHNATPISVYTADPMGSAITYASVGALQAEQAVGRQARLRRLAGADPMVKTMVTQSPNEVEAILLVAKERDADVVVVGHRRRSWLSRWFARDIAERIVERCSRSVLLVPVERRATPSL